MIRFEEPVAELWIAGFPVLHTSAPELSARVLAALARGEQTLLFFANTNFIVQCAALRRQMHGPDVLIANDGIGMELAARLFHRRRFIDNLNGTDFIPPLLAEAKRRVFLLGARPGVADLAAARLVEHYGVAVAGVRDGYAGTADPERLVGEINASGAEIVLVAFGNPLQEQWILRHRDRLDARLLVGVGALFDFLSGEKSRAPALVRRLRLEWLYRLGLEPRRLARRYTLDIVRFLLLCAGSGRQALPPRES